MDSTRSSHPTQAPAQPSSFAPAMSSLVRSTNLANAVAHPSGPFSISSKPTPQNFTSPLQPTSIGAMHHSVHQSQPFAQALNSSSTGLPEATHATQPAPESYPQQVNSLGGPTATAPFLQDFSLVAEAAKRAQMSIVMRDLESVTL